MTAIFGPPCGDCGATPAYLYCHECRAVLCGPCRNEHHERHGLRRLQEALHEKGRRMVDGRGLVLAAGVMLAVGVLIILVGRWTA